MAITTLYLILGISTALLLGVALAFVLRVRRLSRASKTQFRLAVAQESPNQQPEEQPVPQR